MVGKLPLGVISPHVKMSSGGCVDPLKFYATTYCTAYGREEFKPRVCSHVGTGYRSNLRPLVSYQPSLDALDNPAVTSKSYSPLEGPDGQGPLPWNMHQTCSGYGRERPGVGPLTKEVEKVHFDTREHGPQAIPGLEPKAMPLLLQLQDKGPPERENAGHNSQPTGPISTVQGPRSRTSECHSKYLSELNAQPDLLQRRTIGAKERTGFTKGNAQSPLDFLPPSQALLGDPVLLRGRSVTKPDFLPVTNPQGSEFLPVLAQGSERETGYSRANDRMLNPRVTPPGPAPSSTAHGHFLHPRPMQQTNVALLGHQTIGTKESTGFSINTGGYICSPGNPDRDSQYLTTYSQGFFENIPKGLDREGWTRGGIHPLKPSGYTLNQGLTCLEHSPSAPESLWCPHSHRGR
ncbi:hypothetical protein H920_09066 [Fukomys damarensis]|uniref:Protein phosphatase 1 regulatory subunit 32 n=1 Tax=Fukomys damarensis TaxID=885580 RepID=A0A091DBE4_FUKDA|nr:hypothetical protein H920_09066 [Fukomys damarensis]